MSTSRKFVPETAAMKRPLIYYKQKSKTINKKDFLDLSQPSVGKSYSRFCLTLFF